MGNLAKKITVSDVEYVVHAVDAQSQYKILQKLLRYGCTPLVSGMVKAEAEGGDTKTAFVAAILSIVQLMPDEDQDFCINKSLEKTSIAGESEPISIASFTGRIAQYTLVGAKAIGVQLGDFSCFLSLIQESAAKLQEGKE